MESGDYARFVHDMFEFNDEKPANNTSRLLMNDIVSRSSRQEQERTRIVDIHGWCLMGNHYHLLLSGRRDGGISDFLRKLNVGYAKYFNEKYKRTGTLFQGRTKKIRINSDAHYLYILHYIHLNPLDFLKGAETWRALRIKNMNAALAHIEKYRWSSYRDYTGKPNFPSIMTTSTFGPFFGNNYKKALTDHLKDIELADIKPYLLE